MSERNQGGVIVAEPGIIEVIDQDISRNHASLRPWQVIVYDDPVNTMNYVVAVFQMLFGFPYAEAERKMNEVHHSGRSIVATGPREECEFHVERLGSCGLTAGMEPV